MKNYLVNLIEEKGVSINAEIELIDRYIEENMNVDTVNAEVPKDINPTAYNEGAKDGRVDLTKKFLN